MPMRAVVFAAGVLVGVVPILAIAASSTPAWRQTAPAPSMLREIAPEPRLPLNIRIPPPAHPLGSDLPLRLDPLRTGDSDPLGASAVSIGPLRARLGGTATRAHIARYKLEGMDVLGGSISGTFDGRGARVYLRWPPSDDE